MGSLGEALPTDLTLVRFLPGVDSAVNVEIGAATEALPTAVTPVGFLSRVNGQVRIQVRALIKALTTLGACVGLLPRVNPLMGLQIGALTEPFAALVTPVALLPRVDVRLTRRTVTGILRGHTAPRGLLSQVHLLMAFKAGAVTESCFTFPTLAQSLSAVDTVWGEWGHLQDVSTTRAAAVSFICFQQYRITVVLGDTT